MQLPPPQARPQLAPGLRVVRRGPHHLQVGLHEACRVLLPRTEAVQRALRLVLEHRPPEPDDPAVSVVLEHLHRRGALVWVREPAPDASVAVRCSLAIPGLLDVSALLAAAGVGTAGPLEAAQVVLVVTAGELDRDLLDPLVRLGTSHLVVRLVDGGALLGPFVVPGTSACLRCIDAHQSIRDPDHVAVTARYVRATERARPDGVGDVDPALAAVALSWAVRDVVAHLRGDEPSTWSRTLFLTADPARRLEQQWARHPRCGCCWSPGNPSSGTMEV